MLEGKIINLDPEKKQGQVEQLTTQRVFPFTYNVWEGEEEELATNLEVEFVVENRVITKMKLKISLEEANQLISNYTLSEVTSFKVSSFMHTKTSVFLDTNISTLKLLFIIFVECLYPLFSLLKPYLINFSSSIFDFLKIFSSISKLIFSFFISLFFKMRQNKGVPFYLIFSFIFTKVFNASIGVNSFKFILSIS